MSTAVGDAVAAIFGFRMLMRALASATAVLLFTSETLRRFSGAALYAGALCVARCSGVVRDRYVAHAFLPPSTRDLLCCSMPYVFTKLTSVSFREGAKLWL